MKKLLGLLLAVLMVLSVVACAAPAAAPTTPAATDAPATDVKTEAPVADADPYAALDAVVLKGADNAGVGAAAQLYGELITEKIKEITGGKLTIEYYPNSQLGNDQELQNQMLAGDIDFVICQTAQTVNFVPEVAIFDLPMVFAKYDAATIDKALNKSAFTEKINEFYNAKGMVLLHYLQGGTFRETTSNREVRKLDDFAGLGIRTMENANHMAFWKALGANPTPLPWSEVYVSLQQGLIEAQENATDTCAGNNLNEVQKHLILTHHILYCNQFIISKTAYDKLDPAYQAALQQAVDEAAAVIEAQLVQINADNTKKLQDGGMTVIELEPSFIDEVLAKAAGVYDTIGQAIGADLVKLLQDELAK